MPAGQQKHSIFWGGLLILLGLAALADNLFGSNLWLWIGTLSIGGLGALLVYLTDTNERWPLIPAYALLTLAALIAFIELELLPDNLIAPVVIALVGLPFVAVVLYDRSQWWALIPGYILLSVAVLVGLLDFNILADGWVASYVLAAIALPFITVFLRDRRQWWTLIPAYVMVSTGLMIGLIEAGVLRDTRIAVYAILSVALPFLAVYAIDRRQWWALIPGGIMSVVGLSILLAAESLFQYVIPVAVILAGVLILVRVFNPTSEDAGGSAHDPET